MHHIGHCTQRSLPLLILVPQLLPCIIFQDLFHKLICSWICYSDCHFLVQQKVRHILTHFFCHSQSIPRTIHIRPVPPVYPVSVKFAHIGIVPTAPHFNLTVKCRTQCINSLVLKVTKNIHDYLSSLSCTGSQRLIFPHIPIIR